MDPLTLAALALIGAIASDQTDSGSNLAHTLLPPGQDPRIGPELGTVPHTGIGTVMSDYGSKRYLLSYEGEILAGLQVTSRHGVHATIANVYTLPAYRRKGLGRTLLNAARRDFKTVSHSEHLSGDGAAWAKAVEQSIPLDEVFAWLNWHDFNKVVSNGALPKGALVVADPGDGPLTLRNGRQCLKVMGPARVRPMPNEYFETLEPLDLEGAEFWTTELDPQWEPLSEIGYEDEDESFDPSTLDVSPSSLAYHGAPAHLKDKILAEGLNPPDREEIFFSDQMHIPKSFGDVVFAFPWPKRWQERWLGEDLHGGDFWTTDPIPPEELEVVYEKQP